MSIQRIRYAVACTLVALGAVTAPAEAAPLQAGPGSKIEVRIACTPMGNTGQGKIDHEHKVSINVTDANGNPKVIEGEIHRSGTAAALCRDLKASLKAAGADPAQITYGPKDPNETNDKEREATYILELPPGWKADPTTTVQKKTKVENGKPKWKTCSKNSHLSLKVLASAMAGGLGNVAYIGSGESHAFPVVVALELRRVNGDATEPMVIFSGEYASAAGGPGALLELAQALQSAGFFVSAAADELTQSQGLVVLDPSGQPFSDVSFVASYGEGTDDDDKDATDGSEEWVEIRSVVFVF